MGGGEQEIKINDKAFNRLSRARREGETLSDVIIRLSAATLEGLQRRGEQEIVTSDGRKLTVSIAQDKCLGAMSCVTLAPAVFAYDTTEKGLWRRHDEPLGMKEVEEGEVGSEAISLAAESCPYQAIKVRDAETGEVLFP
ncbi:MAG: ferredoxin [Nitrososphaerales archaeon]|nr:ferredoxin [Nitrososphaerales archaeon]